MLLGSIYIFLCHKLLSTAVDFWLSGCHVLLSALKILEPALIGLNGFFGAGGV